MSELKSNVHQDFLKLCRIISLDSSEIIAYTYQLLGIVFIV